MKDKRTWKTCVNCQSFMTSNEDDFPYCRANPENPLCNPAENNKKEKNMSVDTSKERIIALIKKYHEYWPVEKRGVYSPNRLEWDVSNLLNRDQEIYITTRYVWSILDSGQLIEVSYVLFRDNWEIDDISIDGVPYKPQL